MSPGRLVALGCLAIAIAVLAARPAPTPGPMLRDFEAYWSAGRAWNASADPYARAIWTAERTIPGVEPRRDELLPFIDPPASLLGWSLLARLPYRSAATVWLAVLAGTLLALVLAVLRGSGGRGGVTFLAACVLAVAFGPITSDLALGQLALPAFFGATLLVVAADRSLAAGALAAVPAFLQPNVALGLASQLGRNRATLALVLGAIATYALGVLAAGWGWPVAYARAVAAHAAAERLSAIQLTPSAIAHGFGAPPFAAQLVGIALALLATGAAIALAFTVRERFARFTAWSALVPFVGTFVHEHDLLVAYPAALWCALRTRGSARAAAFAGTLLVAVDWLGLAQRPTGVPQSALLALAAASAFAALGTPDLRAMWRVTAACAALFAAAAWLATAHPAPVWPDALGNFHADPRASSAQVWFEEQGKAGLLAGVPAWALLRSLSLLGCALLAYAIYRHCPSDRTA